MERNPDIQWKSRYQMGIQISTGFHHSGQHSFAILDDKETSSNNQTSWDVRPLLGLMMPQIAFWFCPAVEVTEGFEGCKILCFWMISQHSHVILFCHGAFWLIVWVE